jgi:hypothetical protein
MASRMMTPLGGTGYLAGSPKDFDRAQALDVHQLFAFLCATQPEVLKKLAMQDTHEAKDIKRIKFLTRLNSEVGKRDRDPRENYLSLAAAWCTVRWPAVRCAFARSWQANRLGFCR